jgi:hypothetical protein
VGANPGNTQNGRHPKMAAVDAPSKRKREQSQCTNWESGDQSRHVPRCHPG